VQQVFYMSTSSSAVPLLLFSSTTTCLLFKFKVSRRRALKSKPIAWSCAIFDQPTFARCEILANAIDEKAEIVVIGIGHGYFGIAKSLLVQFDLHHTLFKR
jgi:hypothetical protein